MERGGSRGPPQASLRVITRPPWRQQAGGLPSPLSPTARRSWGILEVHRSCFEWARGPTWVPPPAKLLILKMERCPNGAQRAAQGRLEATRPAHPRLPPPGAPARAYAGSFVLTHLVKQPQWSPRISSHSHLTSARDPKISQRGVNKGDEIRPTIPPN